MKKATLFAATLVAAMTLVGSANAGFKEIQCSTDAVFGQNDCNQCFEGGAKAQGATVGFITDKWSNKTDKSQILYKDAQANPQMISYNDSDWDQTPDGKDFWEHPAEFNALYSDEHEGYVLPAGKEVTWIESKTSYAYKLNKNTAEAGKNIGLLVFPISVVSFDDAGAPSENILEHKECVLFKSQGVAAPKPETKPAPKKELPQTGPAEYLILLVLAMLLGFGFMQLRKNS